LDPLRASIQSAVVKAAKRDHADWAQIAGHLSKSIRGSNAVTIAIGAVLVLAASVLIKVPLMIPVNGMVTAMEASRIYAPAEGIVEEVLVADGDTVSRGMPLVRLRSPELDLQQRALEGAMMTAQNRLDSLQIARTDGRFSADNDQNLSADDKVLRTEIKGLQKQLELIQAQQAALLITSPIDGHVDGWDLQNSLQARPVAVGQLLLNVISEPAGWKVQLDVPDQNVGYLLQHQSVENCRVRFRLRSDATVVHEGKIDTIADSAQLDRQGNSIVRATLPFIAQGDVSIREGATVVAQVDCGKHSVGFVWLRGLIEWWRTSSWL
jgi:multidrug efflux pump subunit AcrA (membrane-fusion protein)